MDWDDSVAQVVGDCLNKDIRFIEYALRRAIFRCN